MKKELTNEANLKTNNESRDLSVIMTDFYWLFNLCLEESSVFVILPSYIICDTLINSNIFEFKSISTYLKKKYVIYLCPYLYIRIVLFTTECNLTHES